MTGRGPDESDIADMADFEVADNLMPLPALDNSLLRAELLSLRELLSP